MKAGHGDYALERFKKRFGEIFVFAPMPVIAKADITVPAVIGNISAACSASNDSLCITLDVPKGATGRIVLPHTGWASVTINGKRARHDSLDNIGGMRISRCSQARI